MNDYRINQEAEILQDKEKLTDEKAKISKDKKDLKHEKEKLLHEEEELKDEKQTNKKRACKAKHVMRACNTRYNAVQYCG